MANQEHLDILKQGVETWNQWRQEHVDIQPDLYRADLNRATLYGADLRGADLREANLISAHLTFADLRDSYLMRADLSVADLREADLSRALLGKALLDSTSLSGAKLIGSNLWRTNLRFANLSGADISSAHLSEAILVNTNFAEATLTNCNIYGIAAWNVELKGARQNNLVITPFNEPTIAVDNLEVAQFIYWLLNNPKIRDVIDTIAKKAVLILGRFTPKREAVLDALREALRTQGYLPILFDFDKPSRRDWTETVSTLAHLARFIIIDLTNPSSAPYEVGMIASNHIRPVQALFHPSDQAKRAFSTFPDLIRSYHWVLPPYEYEDQEQLLASLQTKIIEPAEQKAQELEKR